MRIRSMAVRVGFDKYDFSLTGPGVSFHLKQPFTHNRRQGLTPVVNVNRKPRFHRRMLAPPRHRTRLAVLCARSDLQAIGCNMLSLDRQSALLRGCLFLHHNFAAGLSGRIFLFPVLSVSRFNFAVETFCNLSQFCVRMFLLSKRFS